MRKHVIVFGLATAVAAALQAQPAQKLPFTVAKETTVVVTPLKDDGSPDYVAALNERTSKGVTPQNNALARLFEVLGTENGQISEKTHDDYLKMLGIPPTPINTDVWVDFMTFLGGVNASNYDDYFALHKRLWKADESAPAVQLATDYLKIVDPLLDRAAIAVARSKWWSPAISNKAGLLGVLLPSLGRLRDVANTFAIRATLRAGSGDFAGFLADVKAMKQFSAHLGTQWTLIERLVGVAIDALADDTIGTVAASGTLTEDQCKQLRTMLAGIPSIPTIVTALDLGERWDLLEMTQTIARGHLADLLPAIGGSINDWTFDKIEISEADWNTALASINKEMNQIVAALSLDSLKKSHEQSKQLEDEIARWKADPTGPKRQPDESPQAYGDRIAKMIMAAFFPSLGRADELRRQSAMEDAMVDTLIQAAQLKAKNGAWPKNVDELTAAGIALPPDIYNEQENTAPHPVVYRVTQNGVRIYSVGINGIDDGGVRDSAKKMDDIGVGATLNPK